jgi:hypothetical protein
MATAKDVINEAVKHVGYTETGNNITMFGKWYGMNGAAWCAMFVSYCMNKAGAGALIKGAQTAKGSAQVSAFVRHAQKKKWAKIAPSKATTGDIVIFDFPGGYETDHVGFIRKPSGKSVIHTIEGNTSGGAGSQSNGGGVFKRDRSFGVVHSIWRPPYDAPVAVTAEPVAEAPVSPVEAPTPVVAPVTAPKAFTSLKKGSKGSAVKQVQTKVGVTADGDFGPITEKAVKAYQTKKGIVVTGIVNEETWKRLGL